MNINEIQDLIKFVAKSGVYEVEIERKDFKITIKSDKAHTRRKKGEEVQHIQQIPMNIQPMQIPAQPVVQAPAIAPAPAPAAPATPADTPAPTAEDNYITVKSPMIGTFYRSSGPDKDPFVGVGDIIEPGKVVCIIEAMKLFNEIESEISGKIVKVLVDDATPVEYDQPLFLVDPS
ncbi:MAG: acetyl-CoA carboxylase biotin carboxyl carrier protein [Flavobacteriales bacterium]|nr:acetyl-CoA carboxylase biotin carboxyl carrier protein [Flavobacteriales bacterium]